MTNLNKVMIAPDDKGFTIFRGDTARLEKDKIKGTLYDIGKSIITAIQLTTNIMKDS